MNVEVVHRIKVFFNLNKEVTMKVFADLFATDYGMMSIGVIVVVIVMGAWFSAYFKRKIAEDEKRAGR